MEFSRASAKASWILEATPDGSSLHETHRRHHTCARQTLTNHPSHKSARSSVGVKYRLDFEQMRVFIPCSTSGARYRPVYHLLPYGEGSPLLTIMMNYRRRSLQNVFDGCQTFAATIDYVRKFALGCVEALFGLVGMVCVNRDGVECIENTVPFGPGTRNSLMCVVLVMKDKNKSSRDLTQTKAPTLVILLR